MAAPASIAASRVNFRDLPTFSRFFRRYTGRSPKQYRESIYFN